MPVVMMNRHDKFHKQGRIQDLKLGVAQMDWKILKTGVGGCIV